MNLLQYDSQCIVKTIKYVIMKPTASAIKAAIKFENLLEKDGTVSIQGKNLQTEMFKISKNFYVPLMSKLFHYKVNHDDLRNPYEFSISNVNIVFHGQESISYLGPFIWQLI